MGRPSIRVPLLLTLTLTLAACSDGSHPTSPSQSSTSAADSFTIDLPIRPADSSNIAYGIWPFGVHGSSHAIDGHPGFDFEYKIGSPVLASADGLVDSINPDAHDPSRSSVRLRHPRAVGDYLTDYTNLVGVPANVIVGAAVTRGQVLGTAGAFPGGQSAMIHFQLGDPTHLEFGMIIAPPANYLTASARAELDDIWQVSAYRAEWCEPLLANSRDHGFPFSRTWTLQSGDGPAQIAVTCPSDAADVEYTFRAPDGTMRESGVMRIGWDARPTTVDFQSSSGSTRLATYDIVSDNMRLALGAPGASRPSLAAPSIYSTSDK